MVQRFLPGLLLAAALMLIGAGGQEAWNLLHARTSGTLSHTQSCAVGVIGTTYLLKVTGPTARHVCDGFLADSLKSKVFPEYSSDGDTAGRVLVCQAVETDGNLHQVYDASRFDFYAQTVCQRFPAYKK